MITQEERARIRRDYDNLLDETASRLKQEFGLDGVELHPFGVTCWTSPGNHLKILIVRDKETRAFEAADIVLEPIRERTRICIGTDNAQTAYLRLVGRLVNEPTSTRLNAMLREFCEKETQLWNERIRLLYGGD